ncbi:MAG: DNA-binding protein [Planctomycetota bacterium]|nr:MAG: DNA-binding protein [Planctomycetota bacterium]
MSSETLATDAETTTAADIAPRLALRPKEAAKSLGIGERLLWSLTNRGEIPHVKLGKAVLYPIAELERWLSEQAQKKGGRR